VFFSQERVGRDGRPFRIHKFRTMVPGAERLGANVSPAGDPRVTRVGGVLRRSHLDELPQLLNVLVGEMSLVGPRPETPEFVALYSPGERRVLSVRPGLAGPSTLAYRHEAAMLAASDDPGRLYVESILHDRVRLDLTYLERRSLRYDLGVMLATLLAPLLATLPPGVVRARTAAPAGPRPDPAAIPAAAPGPSTPPRRAEGPAAGSRPSRS
jgi:lipopolysaccharide/colanic/teichoic acid biosynthesis glycosyltransferase